MLFESMAGGAVAKHASPNVAFLMLAAIAAGGLVFFKVFMPETRGKADDAKAGPQGQAAGQSA